MKRILHLMIIAALVTTIVACSKEPSTTNADSKALPASALVSTPAAAVAASAPASVRADIVDKVQPALRVTIPAGTKLRVALLDGVSSDKSRAGDSFMASLTEPIVANGKTVLATGTKIRGHVVDANDSGRVKGRASLALKLTEIVRENGKSVNISTKQYTAVAQPTKKRDAAIIGGGAGLGAAIGAIAGGGKGAAIGAAVGGGAGTGTVLATKGKEIRFAPEHMVSFTVASPIEI